jgi:hypothetical protein
MTTLTTYGAITTKNLLKDVWYSKYQNVVEMSIFGSEFCAMKTEIDMIQGLFHKLQKMCFLLAGGPISVFYNNESVVKNSMAPESTLKKYCNMEATPLMRVCFLNWVEPISHRSPQI